MKTYSSFFRWCYISLAFLATTLLATAGVVPPQAADGGLQMSVNTSAYRVYVGDPVPTRTRADRAQAKAFKVRETLVASVQLLNRSSQDLTFSFADDAAAQRRFDFRVFDSEGTEVWASNNVESDAVATAATATLRKRSKWSASVQIPLKIDGVRLAPGVYTLEASLAGEPKIGATTLFEVAVPPPVPQPPVRKDTGIKGQVLSWPGGYVQLNGYVVSPTVMPRGVKAAITVQQILQDGAETTPFFWQGGTGEDGRFLVNTPPGKFRVHAFSNAGATRVPIQTDVVVIPGDVVKEDATRSIPLPSVPPSREATAETTVRAGAFSTVELPVGGGFHFEQPQDTGVKGQIFAPTAENEMVVAPGAMIVVEELGSGSFFGLRPPFRWTGWADAEGRFQVNTARGRFLITAHFPKLPSSISLPLLASREVEVTAGQFTDVRLDLKPGFIVTGTRKISSVSSVKLRVLPTFAPPAMIEISAEGMVNTGGWSNGLLLQRGITPEGIIEFDFVANPPTGIATQAFAPISAVTTVPQPSNFRGVRVFAQSNSKEAAIE